ncbi:histidine kinase/DNA gyrase B/HSP90-like ATPase [Alteromonadaceae bacterium 2753L.S.0a.02]|nr:histidine kinase/DNA gyrase B/HSP90-like ATPase [Alteromonadaceae bacterium 2753L.S.0a.02]
MSEANTIDFSLVLASSVHDMKNSVGMLLASLESVIEDTPPTNEIQARRFSTLHYEASRINSELIQLLTIYRMQNEFLPVHVDEHYVIDILEDQIARNHMLMETKGVSVALDCDHDLNWYFDHDLLGSVVHNILVNCVRYTNTAIRISASVDNDLLCISIADDGPGYPPEMLCRPAGAVEDAEVSKGGTHLGLYFAEKIAGFHRQHNRTGYIDLYNGEPLGGGVFKVYIP